MKARVLLVGAGGLGSSAALYLAAAGESCAAAARGWVAGAFTPGAPRPDPA